MRNPLYRLYERRLASGLDVIPAHIGLILDGNRRFARERGLGGPADGYRQGAAKIHEVLDWCRELDIGYVTLWMLSTDNLERSPDELSDLVDIIAETVDRIATDGLDVHLTAVGAIDNLPEPLRAVLKHAAEATEQAAGLHVQVAVGYGGRQEIVDAFKGFLAERRDRGDDLDAVLADVTLQEIAEHLYTTGTPDPDLIIRTSGEIRLSGFLLWQSVHSEFYFCEAYWPEFRKTDFLRALRDYARRQRRYGR